jgi:hypothetical protein
VKIGRIEMKDHGRCSYVKPLDWEVPIKSSKLAQERPVNVFFLKLEYAKFRHSEAVEGDSMSHSGDKLGISTLKAGRCAERWIWLSQNLIHAALCHIHLMGTIQMLVSHYPAISRTSIYCYVRSAVMCKNPTLLISLQCHLKSVAMHSTKLC